VTLGAKKITNLHSSIQSILKAAIKDNGTTIISFSYGEKHTGNYKNKLMVFGRAGLPCNRCGGVIKKIYVGQRGTHFCPRCQRK
jgi:formamidopyrimidine-DNA glycosylase|tara:strand:+ start:28 stop:279 length:252 start_codon:yes stop_codon:yes gene_type:complete